MGTSTEVENIKSARKPHNCSWCAEAIEQGQPYSRYRWFDGGDASKVKLHPECLGAMNELMAEEGEIEFSPGEHPRGCCCAHDPGCWDCHPEKTVNE